MTNTLHLNEYNTIINIKISELLDKIEIPEFQRVVDDEHTNIIYKHAYDDYVLGNFIFTNVIHVSRIAYSDKYSIIDGQHRICAYNKLYKETKYDVNMVVWIHLIKDYKENYTLFNKLNSHKPVLLFDTENATTKYVQLSKWFMSKYKKFIKTTDKPIGFNFNLDNLLKNFKIVFANNPATCADITNAIDRLNKLIISYNINDMYWLSNKNAELYKEFTNKGEEFPAFVMIKDTYKLVHTILLMTRNANLYLAEIFTDAKLSKDIKLSVWKKYMNYDIIGKCCICAVPINYVEMCVVENVPRCLGGSITDLTNLRPCCKSCQESIGYNIADEYKL